MFQNNFQISRVDTVKVPVCGSQWGGWLFVSFRALSIFCRTKHRLKKSFRNWCYGILSNQGKQHRPQLGVELWSIVAGELCFLYAERVLTAVMQDYGSACRKFHVLRKRLIAKVRSYLQSPAFFGVKSQCWTICFWVLTLVGAWWNLEKSILPTATINWQPNLTGWLLQSGWTGS